MLVLIGIIVFVLETVETTDADEQFDLPPPMNLSELENMSAAQKRMASMLEAAALMEMEIEYVDIDQYDDTEIITTIVTAPKNMIVTLG
jgi:splicing factor 3A subunit 1